MSLLRTAKQLLPKIKSGVRHYVHHVTVREKQPPRHLNGLFDGERVIEEPQQELTTVVESVEDFKHVEKLLGSKTVPEPPKHDHYPTPSGWVPQTASPEDLPYFIRRTRFHNYPIYVELFSGGNRKMTLIKFIEGDIWAMEADVHQYLVKHLCKKMYTQVDEVCRKIRVRGEHLGVLTEFCLSKGL